MNAPWIAASLWLISSVLKNLILTIVFTVLIACMQERIFGGPFSTKWFSYVQLLALLPEGYMSMKVWV